MHAQGSAPVNRLLLGVSDALKPLPFPGQTYWAQRPFFSAVSTGCVQEEIFKARQAALKREEELARGELARLEAEKTAHIR